MNSTWIRDLNVRTKSIKLLEENTGKSSWPRSWQRIFRCDIKSVSNKRRKVHWTSSKFNTFCAQRIPSSENTIHEIGKYLQIIHLKSILYLKYIKNTYNWIIRRRHPVKKRAKDLNRPFFREDTSVANKPMKRCWTSLPIREILQNHKMPLHTHKGGYNKKSQVTTSTGEEVGKKEPRTLWLRCKRCGHFREKRSEN